MEEKPIIHHIYANFADDGAGPSVRLIPPEEHDAVLTADVSDVWEKIKNAPKSLNEIRKIVGLLPIEDETANTVYVPR